MKRRIVITLLLVLGIIIAGFVVMEMRSINVKADTWIEGHITTDTTWIAANSPYLLTGNVYVDEGATLTIEPGVVVKFGGYISIYINGSLYSVGTNTNKIIFTSNKLSPEMGDWNTIKFQGNKDETFVMKYNIVKYGNYGVTISSVGSGLIENCEFYNNTEGIHVIGDSNVQIKNNAIKFNQIGISSEGKKVSDILIADNIISNNIDQGIYLSASRYLYDATITDNNISSNGGSGIYLHAEADAFTTTIDRPSSYSHMYDMIITGNNISSNDGSGIYLHANDYIYNVTITGNDIASNDYSGIRIYSKYHSADVEFDIVICHNYIHSNYRGYTLLVNLKHILQIIP